MRVLVVEDNLINQQITEELLTAQGASVSLAANGQLGVDTVRHAAPQFDVVLVDVQMPVMDGFEATHEIRQGLGLGQRQLPVIAMTANAMARMAGCDETDVAHGEGAVAAPSGGVAAGVRCCPF